jgi:hypothetical protein
MWALKRPYAKGQEIRNVTNGNKCFIHILLYIYHLEQGIVLWISQNPSGPASTVNKYPIDQTQKSVYFRGPEESHRHSKSQSCSYAIHIHSQSVTCWITYWWQQKTPKNNSHVNSHFSSWWLLLTKIGVRISDTWYKKNLKTPCIFTYFCMTTPRKDSLEYRKLC